MGKIEKYYYLCCRNGEKKEIKEYVKKNKKSPYIIIDDIGKCDAMLIVGPISEEMQPAIKFAHNKGIAMEYIEKEKLQEQCKCLDREKQYKRSQELEL